MQEKTVSPNQRIKELRSRLGISMEELSRRSGIALSSISRWESGVTPTIKISSISKMADSCGVNPLWLLGYDVPFEARTEQEAELERKLCDYATQLNEKQLEKVILFIEQFL